MSKYILAIDQGTTSSRAILIDKACEIIATAQKEFRQIFPKPGWVEHDPLEIWDSQLDVINQLFESGFSRADIAAIGITNQRETTVIWDRKTGEPIYNAIVWQDRRTSAYCNSLKSQLIAGEIKSKTGLILDAYFSATKIKWILDEVEGAKEKAQNGALAFGTIDSWLVWNLCSGQKHATDVTNASRTMLFNIRNLEWDKSLLEFFDIPLSIMPEVVSCSENIATTSMDTLELAIPIMGIAGDQQAALFGQLCTEPGMLKTTYGTGCFMVLNTGTEIIESQNQLLTTIGWQINNEVSYALEGSIFVGGAIIQWLRDGLEIIAEAKESELAATSVENNGGVYFVPALTGLGAPHWDQFARGAILGITRGTKRAHIIRAALESIAFQVNDVLRAMERDTKNNITELRVDGGAVANAFLMQFQADIAECKIVVPSVLESTALGAGFLAGLASGFWKSIEELRQLKSIKKEFKPKMNSANRDKLANYWNKALERAKNWETAEL